MIRSFINMHNLEYLEDVSLKKYNTYRLNTIARYLIFPRDVLELKELINYLTQDNNGEDIWKSEIFGRSLDVIVQEGIQAKLSMMPDNIRYKLGTTLTKVINKGSNNMIAIVL